MAVAADHVFMELPAPIREAIEGRYRLPLDHRCHQMFGRTDTIHGDPEDHDDALLLLQVKSDQLVGFHWGGRASAVLGQAQKSAGEQLEQGLHDRRKRLMLCKWSGHCQSRPIRCIASGELDYLRHPETLVHRWPS